MAKKNVYFDGTPLIEQRISGIGKVLKETLKALDTDEYAAKYNMFIFVPINERAKTAQFGFTHIKTKYLPYPHKFLSLFSRFRFGPPIDVFLGKGVYIFENFRNWNLLYSRSITYIHDVTFKLFPQFVQEQNLSYLQKYIKLWLHRADAVVTVSETSRKEIEEQTGIENVTVVPNAVDLNEFKPATNEEINAARSKWKLPDRYVVFLGNIEPRKNLVNGIKAFSHYVKESGDAIALVVIGGGGWKNEEVTETITQARADGVAIVRPDAYVPDEDLPAIISGSAALLLPSWHEGFGLPVIQALACGTPVVASDILSLREAANASESVVFAKPDSVDDLADAIKKAVALPHRVQPTNLPTWSESVKVLAHLIDSI